MNKNRKAVIAATGIEDNAVLSRKLNINGEGCTMVDFLYSNVCEEDVDHISIGDTKEVLALNVGETMYIGTSTITRVK